MTCVEPLHGFYSLWDQYIESGTVFNEFLHERMLYGIEAYSQNHWVY